MCIIHIITVTTIFAPQSTSVHFKIKQQHLSFLIDLIRYARQTALERQDLSRTHLAHHELGSTIIIIVITIVTITTTTTSTITTVIIIINIVGLSVFPGAYAAKLIDETQRFDITRNACPGAGACGGMYTANTMSSAIEAMGMSLPYSSSVPAEDPLKKLECRLAGRQVLFVAVAVTVTITITFIVTSATARTHASAGAIPVTITVTVNVAVTLASAGTISVTVSVAVTIAVTPTGASAISVVVTVAVDAFNCHQ